MKPNEITINFAYVVTARTWSQATCDEAAAFWRIADSLLRATGARLVRITTQYGLTVVSRCSRGLELKHKGPGGRCLELAGREGGYLTHGAWMEAVKLAASQTESARAMGELRVKEAA